MRQPTTKVRLGPSGIHVFDRLTGQNLLLEEVRVPQAEWAAAPRHVSMALTNLCDLRCDHCYAPKRAARLGADDVLRWTRELDDNGCLGIGFGGGEPTLYPGFSTLCQAVSDRTALAVTFTTHALHIDLREAAELSGSVHFVRVSMDGVGETYERVRGRKFSSFLRGLANARRIAPVGINYVVNSSTMPDLDDALNVADRFGVAEFLLLPQQPARGRSGIDPATAETLLSWVRSYRGPIPLRMSESGSAGMPVCDPSPCEGGLMAYAHVDAAGVIKRTSFDGRGVAIGPAGIIAALGDLAYSHGES